MLEIFHFTKWIRNMNAGPLFVVLTLLLHSDLNIQPYKGYTFPILWVRLPLTNDSLLTNQNQTTLLIEYSKFHAEFCM